MTRRQQSLLLGVTLIGVGLTFLLDSLGLPTLAQLWKAWPLVLVGFGVLKLLRRRAGRSSRLRASERVLLVLVSLAGLIATSGAMRERSGHDPDEEQVRPWGDGAPGEGAEPFELPELAELDVPAGAAGPIEIDVDGADLRIVAAESPQVVATFSGDGVAPDFRPAEFQLEENGAGVALVFVRGEAPAEARLRLHLRAPTDRPLIVRHRHGRLRLEGTGPATIDAQASDLQASDSDGPLEITATSTNVSLSDLRQGVRLRASSGNISLVDVSGAVDLETSDGSVSVRDLAGQLEVRAERSDLVLKDIAAPVSVVLTEGSAQVRDLDGQLDLVSRRAVVDVLRVSGPVSIDSEFRNVTVSRVNGTLTLRGAHASFSASECHGPVQAALTSGTVRLESLHAPTSVRVSDGDAVVNLRQVVPLDIVALRGNVTLTVLDRPELRLEVQADPGQIVAAGRWPVAHEGASASLRSGELAGGTRVSVTVRHGLVRIVP